MSTYPVSTRQGKGTIAGGIALIVAGAVLQMVNIQSAASQGPPEFGSGNDLGNMAALATISGLLVLGGVITIIIGVIRYAQSGPERVAVTAPAVQSTPAAKPAFCSSCGAGIAGEGRFCSSCGASTAH
jgi:hypothetical protein